MGRVSGLAVLDALASGWPAEGLADTAKDQADYSAIATQQSAYSQAFSACMASRGHS
jgi:hypothetical protein